MRVFRSEQFAAVTLAALLSAAGIVLPAAAGGAGSGGASRTDPRITVAADRLVSDRTDRTATFTGNVKVVRGDSTIESDRLTVYYAAETSRHDAALPVGSAIERIVAEGNVKIRSKQLSASTPKAVYTRQAQTIELIGTGTRVVSGSNSITGGKILLHLEGEQLTVSSGGDNRVKAVLEPADRK